MCNGDNATCKGCKGCGIGGVAKILLVIGGLNWGILGVGMLMGNDWNVVNMLLNSWPMVEAIVYVVVGVAAIVKLFGCPCAKCKACSTGGAMPTSTPSASM